MAREAEGKGKEGPRNGLSTIDAVRAIASYNARAELIDERQMLLFLQSWWSRTYNRPLKDPLLLSYTLEELLYEFYDRVERKLAEDERVNQETDKIEEDKDKAVLDWAEEEERKELAAAAELKTTTPNPAQDPVNVAWMEEKLREAKEAYGDDFGEDVDMNFEE